MSFTHLGFQFASRIVVNLGPDARYTKVPGAAIDTRTISDLSIPLTWKATCLESGDHVPEL